MNNFMKASALALTLSTYGHAFPDVNVGAGPSIPGHRGQQHFQDEQYYAAAGRQPNDSSSVVFRPGNDSNDMWTWRVNVTNVRLPDAGSEDYHRVNTEYDLQWPGGGTIQSYLNKTLRNTYRSCPDCDEISTCFTWVAAYVPPNVTSRYKESDNGDCSNVLGSQCAKSLKSTFDFGTDCEGAHELRGLDGCADSLDVKYGVGDASLVALTGNFGNSTNPGNIVDSMNKTIQSGDAFFHYTDEQAPATNESNYRMAESRLQILWLSGMPARSGGYTSSLLCQVVNTTAAQSSASRIGSTSQTTAGVALLSLLTLGTIMVNL